MHAQEFALHAALEDHHWWFKGRRAIIISVLRRHLAAGRCIAEVGCGTGGNLKALAGIYPRVIGVDVHPEAVRFSKTRVDGEIYAGDFRDALADKWDAIDAVILADVLEHVEEDRKFLRELIAPLKPGAILLITVPAHPFLWSPHDVALGHERRYTRKRLIALLDLPGLARTLFLSPFNTALFPLIAAHRLLGGLRSHKGPGRSDLKEHGGIVNMTLYRLFAMESLLLGRAIPLPFGCSFIAVLRKV